MFILLEKCLYGEIPHDTGMAEWQHLTWFLGMDSVDALVEDAKKVAYPAEMGFVRDIKCIAKVSASKSFT